MTQAKHREDERSAQIDTFLRSCDPGAYTRRPIPADASFRRYERIETARGRYILMDAPPPQEDVRPFAALTARLRALGLHAPALYAQDEAGGFLLLEDLGDTSYTAHLRAFAHEEATLYRAAVDVLAHLYRETGPGEAVPAYDMNEYRREVALLAEWCLPALGLAHEAADFLAIWDELLAAYPPQQRTLVLRDYHADNLMWLPGEPATGFARVGLLDYQDALLGDGVYDLISLLEDARRDVSPQTAAAMLRHYAEQTGQAEEALQRRAALLGAQRNCKILGIFHRLHRRDGKPRYLDYLPRVRAHLACDLAHPALAALKAWCARVM